MWRMFIKEKGDRIKKVMINQNTGEYRSYIQSTAGLNP